jgi:hypothetical protein
MPVVACASPNRDFLSRSFNYLQRPSLARVTPAQFWRNQYLVMAGVPVAAFHALLESGDYSDFTIKCQGTEFKIHKNILGAGSGYFKALFRSSFMVR